MVLWVCRDFIDLALDQDLISFLFLLPPTCLSLSLSTSLPVTKTTQILINCLNIRPNSQLPSAYHYAKDESNHNSRHTTKTTKYKDEGKRTSKRPPL